MCFTTKQFWLRRGILVIFSRILVITAQISGVKKRYSPGRLSANRLQSEAPQVRLLLYRPVAKRRFSNDFSESGVPDYGFSKSQSLGLFLRINIASKRWKIPLRHLFWKGEQVFHRTCFCIFLIKKHELGHKSDMFLAARRTMASSPFVSYSSLMMSNRSAASQFCSKCNERRFCKV